MVKRKSKGVHIKISEDFYKIFERERKNIEKATSRPVSQIQFTDFLSKSGAKIIYPKIHINYNEAIKKNKKKKR